MAIVPVVEAAVTAEMAHAMPGAPAFRLVAAAAIGRYPRINNAPPIIPTRVSPDPARSARGRLD
jgi:hypothetical protein